jgi:hypothetical protein
MFTDHFFGAFDDFPTNLRQEGEEWVAEAQGLEARHKFQDQALNDLNAKIYDAISRGELTPDH